MVFETYLQSDLKQGIKVKQLTGNMFTMDNKGNKIIVEVFDNGEPVTLDQTKAITAYMLRSDNKTVIVGTAGSEEYTAYESASAVSLTLPSNAYGVEGQLSIVIKHGGVTVGACTAYVYRSSTDVWVDPEGEIPSIDELEQMLSEYAATNAAAQKVANMTVTAEAASGSTPSVEKTMVGSGDNEHVNLNFKLVRGATGPQGATGATPHLTIGTVTDVPYGTGSSATITGTDENPVLNLNLQRGQSGNETIDDTKGLGDTDFVWSADKDVKELLKIDGEKADIDSVYTSRTASGSVVEIEEAVAEAVKQMRIEIAPLQDLHGYDHPWVGGAGANLFGGDKFADVIVANVSGATKDATAKTVTYSASSISNVTLFDAFEANTQYTIIIARHGSDGASKPNLCIKYTDDTSLTLEYGVTTTNASKSVASLKGQNYGSSSVVDYEKCGVFKGNITESDFTPYSNICPISGWTGASATAYDKNLISRDTEIAGYYINSSGACVEGSAGNDWCASDFVLVSPNTTYYFNQDETAGNATKHAYYDANMTCIDVLNSGSRSFTTPSNCKYMRFSYRVTCTVVQLELGSSYTEPYPNAKACRVTFPSSAGTVYGGTLTVNADGTGTLVVDSEEFILDGDETLTPGVGTPSVSAFGYTIGSYNTYINGKVICDQLVQGLVNTTNAEYGRINIINSSGYTADRVNFAISGVTTVAGMSAYLAQHNLQFIAYYKNPLTYTITTDQVLHLLNGYNTVYADCGDISFDYYAEKYLTTEQAEKERIHESITTSAPVQTISDGADNAPMGLKVAVEPVQDLHGFDYSWVGGAKNNLAKGRTIEALKDEFTTGTWSGNSYTVNGVTFACEVDSMGIVTKVKTSGTASANAVFSPCVQGLESGTAYKLTGCPSGGSSSKYEIGIVKGSVLARDYGNGVEYTPSETTTFSLQIIVRNGQNSAGLEFAPLLTLSTVTDRTWYPYQNICPISGHDKAEVTRTGKNLFDKNNVFIQNKLISATGEISDNTGYAYCADYIPVKPSTAYVFSGSVVNASTYNSVAFYDANKAFIERFLPSASNTPAQFTTPSNCRYLRFNVPANHNKADMQLEEGTVATTYEPFGTVYTIPFNTTMYGGYITVGKDGEVTATVDSKESDIGSLSWEYNSTYSVFQVVVSGKTGTAGEESGIISSCYRSRPYGNNASFDTEDGIIFMHTNGSIRIRDSRYTDASLFKTALTGQTLVYPLATPVTIKLNHCTIRSLLGTNNIWADTGDIKEIHWSASIKEYIDNLFNSIVNATGVSF